MITLLFDHFGPYHLARFRVVSENVVGIEFFRRSMEYAWEVVERKALQLETLFPNCSPNPSTRSLRAAVHGALDQLQPSAVAVPGWSATGALAGLEWCLNRNTPVILMSESTAHDEPRTFWKEWVKRRLVGLCSVALCGGTAHAAYLRQLGMPADRIFWGYDAVDNGHFARIEGRESRVEKGEEFEAGGPWPLVLLGDGPMRPELEALAADLGLLPSIIDGADRQGDGQAASCTAVPSGRYFLASARFVEKKNLPRLLRAYARYRELCVGPDAKRQADSVAPGSMPPATGVSVVPGSLPPATGVSVALRLPGFKQYDELPAWYHGAGAFVHASTTEQWGLVVNEAMAAGLPVLVSQRCGCAPDLVHEGVNGWTFDPFHEEAMAQAMLKMAALPEAERAEMGHAGEAIIANWGPQRFADGLSQAADRALEVGPCQAGWFDRLLLRLLTLR